MSGIVDFLGFVVQVYTWILIARILLSWFPLPSSPAFTSIWSFVHSVTEPFLSIFRRFIPPLMAGGVGFDLSPTIAIVALQLGWTFLSSLLLSVFAAAPVPF